MMFVTDVIELLFEINAIIIISIAQQRMNILLELSCGIKWSHTYASETN